MVTRIPSPRLIVLALLLICVHAAAQTVSMTASFEASQAYQRDAWQSGRFELRNETDHPIDGTIALPLTHATAPAVMTLPVNVPSKSRVASTLSGYFARPESKTKKQQGGQIPPLSIAEWRSTDGGVLARAQIMGIPIARKGVEEENSVPGELILFVNERADSIDEAHDVDALLGQLSDDMGIALSLASIGPDRLTRSAAALHSVKAIVLDDVDPDSFDLAQRAALIEYLRGGGTILMPAPFDRIGHRASWIEPILPVNLIGRRFADHIDIVPGAPPLKLRQSLEIVEATLASGTALLRNADYVHVAIQPVGLGKLIFTSFPINGLDASQPQASVLWQQLLNLSDRQWTPGRSEFGTARYEMLGSMIGKKIAPWSIAAAAVGGYLVLILAVQLIFFGSSRPRAFAISIAGSLLLCGVLIGMGMARHRDDSLQSARLSILNVAPDGGGWRDESIALIGTEDPQLKLTATSEKTALRPALADAANKPIIRQQPYSAEKAGVFAERIERVWQTSSPIDKNISLAAVAHFDDKGFTLETDNKIGQGLVAPLLISNGQATALDDLQQGKATSTPKSLEARADFTSSAVVTSDIAKRRAQMVKSILTPADTSQTTATDEAPILIAWTAAPIDQGTLTPSQSCEQKTMELVRTPLRFNPPAVGTKLTIPAIFTHLELNKFPYDRLKNESVPSQQSGEWLIGFAAPRGLGQLRPTSVTLQLRVSLPAQELIIHKSQCRNGSPVENELGDLVGKFSRENDAKKIDISCDATDFDHDGRVWLLFDCHAIDPSAANITPWQIKELAMSFQAQVVAPPTAIDLGPTTRPNSRGY